MAFVLLPVAIAGWRAGVEIFPEVVMVVAGGILVYFLRYSLWAMSRPTQARVEVLEEPGMVRADYSIEQ